MRTLRERFAAALELEGERPVETTSRKVLVYTRKMGQHLLHREVRLATDRPDHTGLHPRQQRPQGAAPGDGPMSSAVIDYTAIVAAFTFVALVLMGAF